MKLKGVDVNEADRTLLVDENSIWHYIEVKQAAQLASAVDCSWKRQVFRERLRSPWVNVLDKVDVIGFGKTSTLVSQAAAVSASPGRSVRGWSQSLPWVCLPAPERERPIRRIGDNAVKLGRVV